MTRDTSVPILVFLGLPVLDLGPMYATDRRQTDVTVRQTDIRHASSLNKRKNPFKRINLFCRIHGAFIGLRLSPESENIRVGDKQKLIYALQHAERDIVLPIPSVRPSVQCRYCI